MNLSQTVVALAGRRRITFAAAVVCLLILISAALSAFVLQTDDDRPPIIISSGSVILNVAKGSWVKEAAGRFRQELANGKDVKSYSASTGAGAAVCTVTGASITVRYGANSIVFSRALPPAAANQRHFTAVRMPDNASVTAPDARTLVIATTDALVSFSNGATGAGNTCQVAGGKLEIRQVQ